MAQSHYLMETNIRLSMYEYREEGFIVEYCSTPLLTAGYVYHTGSLIGENCPRKKRAKENP